VLAHHDLAGDDERLRPRARVAQTPFDHQSVDAPTSVLLGAHLGYAPTAAMSGLFERWIKPDDTVLIVLVVVVAGYGILGWVMARFERGR
jgi:hypothetical protein